MSKTTTVDKAHPTIKKSTNTDAEKIDVTTTVAAGIKASPNYASVTELATSLPKWVSATALLQTNSGNNASLRAQLKAGEAKQRTLRRQWSAAKRTVISNVDNFCDGSADLINAFSLDVILHGSAAAAAAEQSPPDNIVALTPKVLGQAAVTWDRPARKRDFVVQWATDSANAATYSAQIAWTKKKYVLGGQTSGAHVYFRVAFQDSSVPEGRGAWSAWIAATVR